MRFLTIGQTLRSRLLAGLVALALLFAVPTRGSTQFFFTSGQSGVLTLFELNQFEQFVQAIMGETSPTAAQLELISIEYSLNLALAGNIPDQELAQIIFFEVFLDQELFFGMP